MSKPRLLLLSAKDVQQALPMPVAVDAMRAAFRELSAGTCNVPNRTHIATADGGGDALFMPSYSPGQGLFGLKVVTLFEGNRALGLPFIQGVVLVLDGQTGTPRAVLDGASLTALRTGAASGVGTDLLARPDARVAAIFGAGVQARTQLRAVAVVRKLTEARVFDPISTNAARFAEEMTACLGFPVTAAGSPEAALDGADVVCTATTATTPVFADAAIAPGTHINAVGSYKPHVREIPGDTVCRARVFVDQREAAWEEAGDLIMPLAAGRIDRSHVLAELGELLADDAHPGRTDPADVTFFKSVGVAIQDLCAAAAAVKQAEAAGLGTRVDWG
jgi:ornithine cyclodeaminase